MYPIFQRLLFWPSIALWPFTRDALKTKYVCAGMHKNFLQRLNTSKTLPRVNGTTRQRISTRTWVKQILWYLENQIPLFFRQILRWLTNKIKSYYNQIIALRVSKKQNKCWTRMNGITMGKSEGITPFNWGKLIYACLTFDSSRWFYFSEGFGIKF